MSSALVCLKLFLSARNITFNAIDFFHTSSWNCCTRKTDITITLITMIILCFTLLTAT